MEKLKLWLPKINNSFRKDAKPWKTPILLQILNSIPTIPKLPKSLSNSDKPSIHTAVETFTMSRNCLQSPKNSYPLTKKLSLKTSKSSTNTNCSKPSTNPTNLSRRPLKYFQSAVPAPKIKKNPKSTLVFPNLRRKVSFVPNPVNSSMHLMAYRVIKSSQL